MQKDLKKAMDAVGKNARDASRQIALASTDQKNKALIAIADALIKKQADILKANQQDLQTAKQHGVTGSFYDRLLLDDDRVKAMSDGLRAIAELDDPVGKVMAEWKQPNGLNFSRVRVPLGVIAVIYESRPNVTADAAALCLKSGNAVILRGGSESFHSCKAIMQCIQDGLKAAGLPDNCVQMVPTSDREAVGLLLQMDQYIDVIVPRGGKSLVERISNESNIPLFKHLEGICHSYIHHAADESMATEVVLNAKMRRPGICGATETILIDKDIIASHLPPIVKALQEKQCEIRADEIVRKQFPDLKAADEKDWDTEYLEAIVSVKAVDDVQQAIQHINEHGSQHTDAIITQDQSAADKFLQSVDSAIVMHNTSTQFADGGEFGMGAEIGISTGRLHARGPVGVEQLTTFKYVVRGEGQLRD